MHYYNFNIGDYQTHTAHLDPLEDIAYRRLIDWQFLHERPIPLDIEVVAKQIRMRTHSECIAYVLQEYYDETPEGYINKRVTQEIERFHDKSDKARASAKKRWRNNGDANA